MRVSKATPGIFAGAAVAYALSASVHAQPGSDTGSGSGSGSASGSDSGSGSGSDSGSGSGSGSENPTIDAIAAASEAAAEVIEINDTAPAESASSVHLNLNDLQFRSRTQVSDILRQVPGLMVSQHAGGGKSDQYFIRGFDADHGTDIAIYADGIPVNMPSHGHGQGYADTHFLIPETVEQVDVHKGPYSARFGDFYTAGAMELKTIDKIDGPTLWISGGVPLAGPKSFAQYNRRIVGMASPEIRDNDSDKALIAVQLSDTDGPFDHAQKFRQGNALLKWQGHVGPGDLRLESNWYAGAWNASGQVPESAVQSGLVDRFGSLDPSEGGDTSRTTAQLGYIVRDDHGGTWRASAFILQYQLRLYSDFTLFARDPIHGDEIEQDDVRTTWGLDAAYDKHFAPLGMDTIVTVGTQIRYDNVDTGLWHAEQRVRLADCFGRLAPCNHTTDTIRNFAGYAEANIHVVPHVHVLPGLRFDQFTWGVDDLNPNTSTDPTMTTGGSASKSITSPKLSVEIEASSKLDLFANSGYGFHSNDARGNVAPGGNAGSLARALGAEAGVRTSIIPHAKLSADLWYLHLDSELVWSGDEGGTSPSAPTRRYGVDLEGTYNPAPWLFLDANVSLAHSEFVANAGNGSALALAPKFMGSGGVTVKHGAHFVALRTRGIADRPGNDDGTLTAKGYLIFDLIAGTTVAKKLALNVTINNLLNTEWREAQFADTSAVTPTSMPVEQMHYTPGIPLTATVTAAYTF